MATVEDFVLGVDLQGIVDLIAILQTGLDGSDDFAVERQALDGGVDGEVRLADHDDGGGGGYHD